MENQDGSSQRKAPYKGFAVAGFNKYFKKPDAYRSTPLIRQPTPPPPAIPPVQRSQFGARRHYAESDNDFCVERSRPSAIRRRLSPTAVMMGRATKTQTTKASRGASRSSRAASTVPKKRKPSPKTSTEGRKVRKKTSTGTPDKSKSKIVILKVPGIEHENESETENASTQAEIEELKAELKAAVARSEGLEVQIERDQMDHIQELQKKEADIDVLKSLLEGAKKELSNHKDERAKFEANTMSTIATLVAERDQLLRQGEKPKPPNPRHASPAPVTVAVNPTHLDENMRVENVRKTYLSIKRRYDTLCCITKEVVRCTRGMYLSNFGDFGRLLEQLRNAMEDQDKPAEHPGVEGGKSGLTATPLGVDSQGTVVKGSQGPQA